MGIASRIQESVNFHAAQYEANAGLGLDAYCDELHYHPMADGKYLQACAVLYDSSLISYADLELRVSAAIERLRACVLQPFEKGVGWGLGFPWRALPPTEPFLITSAVVVRGLLDCAHAGERSDELQMLLREGMSCLERWVREWSVNVEDTHFSLPAYSPGIREPIFNAACYCMATLWFWRRNQYDFSVLPDDQIFPRLEGIRSLRVAGLGWTYATGNLIVDLLHQCYILNALADTQGINFVEEFVIEMVGQFATPEGFADALRFVPHNTSVDHSRDIPWLRSFGGGSIELLPKIARLWSLGELLVLFSRLAEHGIRQEGWARLGARTADLIMTRLSSLDSNEGKFPRHVMHALHGLSCYLHFMRRRSQSRNSKDSVI